jgi:uncharacterized protein (TIGR00255 family)
MTGFGRAMVSNKNGRFEIELLSVNRKFLEFSIFLPKEFFSFEMDIRKMLSSQIFRGFVTFRLNFYPDIEEDSEFLKPLKILKKSFDRIADKLKLKKEDVNLKFLMEYLKFIPKEEKKSFEENKKTLLIGLKKALEKLIEMKKKEGEILLRDVKKRLKKVEETLVKIEKRAPTIPVKFESKLKEKLQRYLEEDDERVLKEIAIFSEKVDVTEEIIRLKSHIEQFYRVLKAREVMGRKMDFIMQEMFREVNTITSKALDVFISKYCIVIKGELVKIKEQIQNVE